MSFSLSDHDQSLSRFRRLLPLTAHPRPSLVAFLRPRHAIQRRYARLKVTNIFYADSSRELICQFMIADDERSKNTFVAPLSQLAFGRGHPISREIAAVAQACTARRGG